MLSALPLLFGTLPPFAQCSICLGVMQTQPSQPESSETDAGTTQVYLHLEVMARASCTARSWLLGECHGETVDELDLNVFWYGYGYDLHLQSGYGCIHPDPHLKNLMMNVSFPHKCWHWIDLGISQMEPKKMIQISNDIVNALTEIMVGSAAFPSMAKSIGELVQYIEQRTSDELPLATNRVLLYDIAKTAMLYATEKKDASYMKQFWERISNAYVASQMLKVTRLEDDMSLLSETLNQTVIELNKTKETVQKLNQTVQKLNQTVKKQDLTIETLNQTVKKQDLKIKEIQGQIALLRGQGAEEQPTIVWIQPLEWAGKTLKLTGSVFKVKGKIADLDDLKEAIAEKMKLSIAAPLIDMYRHADEVWEKLQKMAARVSANDDKNPLGYVLPSGQPA